MYDRTLFPSCHPAAIAHLLYKRMIEHVRMITECIPWPNASSLLPDQHNRVARQRLPLEYRSRLAGRLTLLGRASLTKLAAVHMLMMAAMQRIRQRVTSTIRNSPFPSRHHLYSRMVRLLIMVSS